MSTWPEREFNFGPSTTRRKLGRPGVGKHRHLRRVGMPGPSLTGFNGQICGPISWGAVSRNTLHKNLIRDEKVPPHSAFFGKGKCAKIGHRPLNKWGWCSRCHELIAPPEPIFEEVDE
jgi:hypothetical protein